MSSYGTLTRTNTEISSYSNLGNSAMSRHQSLSKMGKKRKTVSFNGGVSVVNVEKWKKYNIDVSSSGGCMAWDYAKNEEKRKLMEERKAAGGCCGGCNIF